MHQGLNPIVTKWLEVSERCLKRCEDDEDEVTDVETASDQNGKRYLRYRKVRRTIPGNRFKRLCLKENKHEHYCCCVVHYLKDEDKANKLKIEIMEKTENGIEPRQSLMCIEKCKKHRPVTVEG